MQERKNGIHKEVKYDTPDSTQTVADIVAAEAHVRIIQTATDAFLDKFAEGTHEIMAILELTCGSSTTADPLDEYFRIQGLLKSTILGAVDRLLQFLDIIPSQVNASLRPRPSLDTLQRKPHHLPSPVPSDAPPSRIAKTRAVKAAGSSPPPPPPPDSEQSMNLVRSIVGDSDSAIGRSCYVSSPTLPADTQARRHAARTRACARALTQGPARTRAPARRHSQVRTHTSACAHTEANTPTHTHPHTHTRTHTHTHTHTHVHAR